MIDNDRMWESIVGFNLEVTREEFINNPVGVAVGFISRAIKHALKDQGLRYNKETKKIESIEPVEFMPKFKKGDILTDGERIFKVLAWDYNERNLPYYRIKTEISEFDWLCNDAEKEFKLVGSEHDPCADCSLEGQGLTYNGETSQIGKTDGKPLTEFEKTFKKLLECYASAMGTPVVEQPIESTMGFIKKHGSSLLDIARNEVIKDVDNMTRYGVMAINQTSFTLGYGQAVDNIRKYVADHTQKNTEASSGRTDSGIEHFADGLIKRMQEIGPYGEPV